MNPQGKNLILFLDVVIGSSDSDRSRPRPSGDGGGVADGVIVNIRQGTTTASEIFHADGAGGGLIDADGKGHIIPLIDWDGWTSHGYLRHHKIIIHDIDHHRTIQRINGGVVSCPRRQGKAKALRHLNITIIGNSHRDGNIILPCLNNGSASGGGVVRAFGGSDGIGGVIHADIAGGGLVEGDGKGDGLAFGDVGGG